MKRYLFLFCAITTLSAGIALAASPPVITETHSWSVGSTTAGISMTANNQKQNSRAWLEYSTESNMSNARKVSEVVDGPIATGFGNHATLSGLKPDTVYYFRGFIKNYDGEVYSPIKSFRTTVAAASQPSVSFQKDTMTTRTLDLGLVCNGGGAEGTCSIAWSTNANMSGERVINSGHVGASPTGQGFYATFALSSVPDDTKIYVQGTMKTAIGTAKTGVRDFVIRNKPI